MIQSYITKVAEFHRAFRHPIHESPDLSDKTINALRPRLIAEELQKVDNKDRTSDFDIEIPVVLGAPSPSKTYRKE